MAEERAVKRGRRLVVWGVGICALCSVSFGPAAKAAEAIQETHLEGLISPYGLSHITISPDGKRVAYVAKAGKKCVVVVDGKKGEEYDSCLRVAFSPDGKRTAYVATKGKKAFVVVDGVKGKEYLTVGQPVFSPDGKTVAYNASSAPDRRLVVVNSAESQKYDFDRRGGTQLQAGGFSFPFYFSPDGKRVAYAAKRDGKQFIVVDGKEGKKHGSVGKITFSPDGRRIAYLSIPGNIEEAMLKGRWSVVIDGVQGKEYAYIAAPVFSPDSKRMAYVAVGGLPTAPKSRGVVVDGVEYGKKYDAVSVPMFSPDSKQLIYSARRGKQGLLVANGQEYKSPEMFVSADLKKMAYRAKLAGKWTTIRCGLTAPAPITPSLIWKYARLSPGGKHMASIATHDGKEHVVLDGKEGKGYGSILPGTIAFSRDGARVCYVASHTGPTKYYRRAFVVMDGAKGKEYDLIYHPRFSPDGKHAVYVAWRDKKSFLVADNKEKELKGKVWPPVEISSDGARVAYIETDLWNKNCFVVVGGAKSRIYDRLHKRLDVPGAVAGVVSLGKKLFVVRGRLD
jgi:WD40 repeat protein